MSILESDASLLDGLSKPKQIAKRITDIGSDGCALTDHGSISNCVAFLQAMQKANKKPVLGCELYVCNEHSSIRNTDNRYLAHLPVLAKNTDGWNTLVKIVSESNKSEHYYHRPRISLIELRDMADGNIIAFSGHLGSHVSDAIESGGIKEGVRSAQILEKIFGKGNFWLECQLMDSINTPKQIKITAAVREISKITGIPCIATPDAHYAYKEDAVLQRILLCSNLGVNFAKGRDPNFGMSTFFTSDCFHIPSYDEMIEYGHTEEELNNTNIILSQIEDYDILKPPMLKVYECPNNLNPDQYLRELCRKGWKKLIEPKIPKHEQQKYIDRIKNELDVLQGAGLSSYFLIVQDILDFVNSNGWLPGPGRGSAAGCLVSYLIGITKIDPIKYNLLFERFYNSGRNTADRVSMPDIDVDIPIKHRGEIIQYIKDKYGEDCVSQMITYQTMKGAKALKEVFRAYGDVTFEEINQITKNIVEEAKIADQLQEMDDPSIIRWCLENRSKDFKDWCEIDDNGNLTGIYADRFEQAIKLEGTKSAQAKHAAGIIVAPRPLAELCPMVYDSKTKKQIAGMEMNDLEAMGLIKLDILGVAMLDKVMCVKELLKEQGIEFDIDIENIDLECPKTWELLAEGNTKGIFQLESRLGQGLSKSLKPENMEHLGGLASIMRPGCISKDTKICLYEHVHKDGNKRYVKDTIENIFNKFQNKKEIPIISYDEITHSLFDNKITNVWYQGKKKVYKINFNKSSRGKYNGKRKYKLKCTSDHPLYVFNKGWTKLEDMTSGDRFVILPDAEGTERVKEYKYTKGTKTFRDIAFRNYEYKCVCCDWDKGSLDVNHFNSNRYIDNDPDNLVYLCPNHHRMYSENTLYETDVRKYRNNYKLPQSDELIWAEFIDYEFVEITEVYDIEVAGPHHNFIAGDMVVHNCLEAKKEDGKTVTDHYISKKNNAGEIIEYLDESLRPILSPTYGEMIYQEQAMAIAQAVAGFDLKQADILRKAIGKKKPEVMAAVKKEFIEGCKEANVVDEMVAHKLFEWIEKSQRYSFNKCLSPETIVETPDGFKTLDEVEIGDLVLCPNDDGDKFITVLNKFENGIKDLYEIELEDGKSISCTLDHKFLCSDGRKHPVYDIIYNNLSILVYNDV